MTIFSTSGGSGQPMDVTYNLTGVGNSVGANATYTASSSLPGLTGYVCIQNFGNLTNNGCFLVVSNTSSTIVVANNRAVAESNSFTIAQTQHTISCSGGGGTGFIAIDAVLGAGGTVGTQPTIIDPSTGYTAAPSGCVLVASGTPATFLASLQSPVQTIAVAGGALAPNTGEAITIQYISGAPHSTPTTDVASTVQVRVQNSLPLTTGLAVIASQEGPEWVHITNVVTSGTLQTLSLTSHRPHPAIALVFQSTNPPCLWFDANAAGYGGLTPWPNCYDAFGAVNSTTLLAGYFQGGGLSGNLLPYYWK